MRQCSPSGELQWIKPGALCGEIPLRWCGRSPDPLRKSQNSLSPNLLFWSMLCLGLWFSRSRMDGFGGPCNTAGLMGRTEMQRCPGSPALGRGCRGRQNGPRQAGFTGKLLCYGMARVQSVCRDYCCLRSEISLVCWSAGVLLHFQKDKLTGDTSRRKAARPYTGPFCLSFLLQGQP